MPSHLSHYSLTHRAIATVSHLFDDLTYTVRHGPLTGMKRKGGLGFLPAMLTGRQETAETRFLAALDYRNATVYDIGGFQGLLTLFFAARAPQVVVYEPNHASRDRLEENLRLNGVTNVRVRSVGLGAAPAMLDLVFDPRMGGGASGDRHVGGQIRAAAHQTVRIPILRLDDDRRLFNLPDPTFVKIDVEGMELAVLQGMPDTLARHPALFIELHGAERSDKLANALGVYRLLTAAGYTRLYSVEQGYDVSPETIEADIPSHLYCTA